MATTTNFGWETPDDTDLVKDGALAMRTLGNAIDTSLVDLKGGTTGQILSKTSNTDMDFTWIANDQGDITAVTAGTGITGGGTSGAVTITNDMATTITASGDIIIGTGSGTYDNLPIGTTGQILTADTTVSPYKVKWAAPANSFVGCELRKSGNQSIANNTDTMVTFDAETFDTDGFHSITTNTSRITIPSGKAGKYRFTYLARFAGNSSGIRNFKFFLNGSEGAALYRRDNLGTNAVIAGGDFVLDLAVNDYVEFAVFQSSGGSLDIEAGTNSQLLAATRFGCQYLGA